MPKENLTREDLDLVDDHLDEEEDEAALWDQLATGESGSEEAAGAGADPSTAGQDARDDDGAPPAADEDEESHWSTAGADGAATAEDDAGKNGDAPAARDDSSNKDAPDDSSGASEQAPDDTVWANATPEQRAAFEAAQQQRDRLEHQLRSDRGRISALTRRLQEIEHQRQDPASAPADQAGAGSDAGSQGPSGGSVVESENWSQLAKEYPEVAEKIAPVIQTLESKAETLQQKNDRFERELAAIGDDRRQAAEQEQQALLGEAHPDWLEVTTSAPQVFGAWLEQQPRHIQEAAYRNADGIVDAQEAADVVGRFKEYINANRKPDAQDGDRTPAGEDGETPPHSDEQPDANRGEGNGNRSASARRNAQRESAASTRGRGPSMGSGIPDDGDEEAIWNQMSAEERRRSAA